ncbi:dinuclear metal center YbgI/SA1388 family protein [Thermosporothrix hazakensis]|jgi:dinuclear metal center YbgI/SA1388 family protein|uniref:GTP cyclohydrolase 1 type 2 homolog n=2 Tax=Thermosporothrix TaxID=768650 RepID=A0A326U255_THEHA|nr:Nif3-like dinuclear metal center hexameric protein [Thermosporothrix hazakensis]PZW24236.1 dinuclear metal center YbgI/SA1388 family protein [Thermosporothrix hazakensis]BBH89682.1 GTP cyclohydrolase 1 type 2 [Thermosporothrix sp. COM3]GCE47868.1 GTP cyclohydrolase 1 type 2 [Thermosporothrix hazakensis]
MNVLRDDIVQFINNYLNIDAFRDYCPNGMQVIGRTSVQRVALGVSANLECFRQAVAGEADMLIVHHGLFWENMPREIGAMMKGRLKLLFDNDITLLGYHLPLDAHPEIGNNVLWLRELGFEVEGITIGNARGKMIGAIGTAPRRITRRDLIEQVAAIAGAKPLVYAYGPQTIRRLGVITGGGEGYLLEAIARGCDTFLTGEVGEPTESYAREEGVNFIAAGHYNSEKIGIQALGELLKQHFPVETFFCDVPNAI